MSDQKHDVGGEGDARLWAILREVDLRLIELYQEIDAFADLVADGGVMRRSVLKKLNKFCDTVTTIRQTALAREAELKATTAAGASGATLRAIKPCPFCGGKAAIHHVPPDEDNPNAGGVYVQCVTCLCSTKLVFPVKEPAEPICVEAWNRRA